MGEAWNDPERCDLAQTFAFACDDLPFEALRKWIDGALDLGAWLILAGHDLGPGGTQVTRVDALAQTAEYCRQRAKDLWVGTVAEVGMAIREARGR